MGYLLLGLIGKVIFNYYNYFQFSQREKINFMFFKEKLKLIISYVGLF